jgi:hypothetical protein
MQYGDIEQRVQRIVRAAGNPIIKMEETGMLKDFINEKTDLFCVKTRCVYKDDVTFTLTSSQATYDLRDSDVFSQSVWLPDALIIDGDYVYNLRGGREPDTIETLRNTYTTYLTDTDDLPVTWVLMQPGTIRLYPAPDQVYSNCYLQGYCLSTPMDVLTDTPDVPTEYHNCLCVYISAQLLGATTDQDVLQTMQFLDSYAAREMGELLDYSDKLKGGDRARGRRGRRSVCL